ncbi:hypothetical protein SUDANB129_00020 [Streptomyces sp. enrichment culture]
MVKVIPVNSHQALSHSLGRHAGSMGARCHVSHDFFVAFIGAGRATAGALCCDRIGSPSR